MKKIIPLILLLLYSGCDDSSTNIDDKVIPSSNVSYSQHIQPIFNVKCVNCHGVGTTEAGLDLTTWSGTKADPRIVVDSLPENSVLVWTIEVPARAGFPQMPPIDAPYLPLTPNQLRGVKTWIAEGAKNN
ncbi:MAG: hypothetical protein A2V93_12295 [Ignavibacteria bacterium RBG_16_34_14]|nr:MAG: hypothetical protein A2V93_12295 [Ignavibacteria bacterium RBG_16_34_14]